MVEVQILHRYMDVTYLGNAGAIAEEKISVRPVHMHCPTTVHPWTYALPWYDHQPYRSLYGVSMVDVSGSCLEVVQPLSWPAA